MTQTSELRQDLVTGEWVVVATARARRPGDFAAGAKKRLVQPKATCPFESLAANALLVSDGDGEFSRPTAKNRPRLAETWSIEVIPNKYPAFGQHGVCAVEHATGPYHWQDGVGFHELVITRDHTRTMADMDVSEIVGVFQAYRERYHTLKDDGCVEYISIFHNHGPSAGASISHPHSQIIAIPVIPPDVGRSLRGSAEYYKAHRACVHCVMLDFERKDKKRIIYENKEFIAIAPFVSRSAFEVRIFPKKHQADFELSSDATLLSLADAMSTALQKIRSALHDPDYNFFIHTAPTAGGVLSRHYHWHIEIIPKTAIWAGFEIGTGIEISTISPEAAAEALRKAR